MQNFTKVVKLAMNVTKHDDFAIDAYDISLAGHDVYSLAHHSHIGLLRELALRELVCFD